MFLQCRKWDAPDGQAVGEAFGLAAGGDVGEADLFGEGRDEGVAARGEFGGDTLFGGSEAGEDEQASVGQGGLPFGGDTRGQVALLEERAGAWEVEWHEIISDGSRSAFWGERVAGSIAAGVRAK